MSHIQRKNLIPGPGITEVSSDPWIVVRGPAGAVDTSYMLFCLDSVVVHFVFMAQCRAYIGSCIRWLLRLRCARDGTIYIFTTTDVEPKIML